MTSSQPEEDHVDDGFIQRRVKRTPRSVPGHSERRDSRTMSAALTFSAGVVGTRVAAKAPVARRQVVAATPAHAAQELLGTVVSTTPKTATVLVSRKVPHPRYHKLINKSKKFAVHDEENTAKVGDVVYIKQCRPMSKSKKFTLGEVVTAK